MRRVSGSSIVLRADTRRMPLPDASVDLVVTSPPYYALRSYKDGGEHYRGQIGDEPSPDEYLRNMWDATDEWARVLKPSGSMFVNLGDKYNSTNGPQGATGDRATRSQASTYVRRPAPGGAPRKSLLMLPERYRIGCADRLGLTVRSVVIWSKTNAMPESADDRVVRSHEDWVHLTKGPDYYSAVDLIREDVTPRNGMVSWVDRKNGKGRRYIPDNGHNAGGSGTMPNAMGKVPRSVWDIPTEPLVIPDEVAHHACCGGRPRPGCEDGLDHYAAFPTAWPRQLIRGWSPEGICTVCDRGRTPVTEQVRYGGKIRRTVDTSAAGMDRPATGFNAPGAMAHYSTANVVVGWACGCETPDAPTRPSVVLDPFGGTGTTALVASTMGRVGISVDMSGDYCWLAQWRTNDPDQIARAMQVAKPPKQVAGQTDDLFSVVFG